LPEVRNVSSHLIVEYQTGNNVKSCEFEMRLLIFLIIYIQNINKFIGNY